MRKVGSMPVMMGDIKLLFGSEFLYMGSCGISRYASNVIKEIMDLNKIGIAQYFYGGKLNHVFDNITRQNRSAGYKKLNSLLSESYYLYHMRHLIRSNIFKARTKKLKGYIYHEPAFIARPFSGPTVVTVHDMSHLRFPQHHPAGRVKYLEKHLSVTLSNVEHIITPSKYVKTELAGYFGLPSDKITVTHLGVGSLFKPRTQSEISTTLDHYKLNYSGYILSVATLEGRKNIDGLVKAYSNLPYGLKKQYPLALVGGLGWRIDSLYSLLRKYKEDNNIRLLGAVSDKQLMDIYSGASLFVYPSWYEGFGLPPLEAMSCGTPVITSKNTVLEEVVDDAAVLVLPGDTDALTEAIESIIEDETLKNKMISFGLERAKLFTWKKCAEKTMTVYEKLARSL